jgi:hypothetical protein
VVHFLGVLATVDQATLAELLRQGAEREDACRELCAPKRMLIVTG